MKSVLMVAEKPSLAQLIAKFLSNGNLNSRKGYNNACSIHEFSGKFPPTGETVNYKFTSVCGHVMSLDFPGKYNSWDKVDPAELFIAPTVKKEANANLRIPYHLEQTARGCSYVVLWLDCDKEGENICFEVLDAVNPALVRSSPNDQIIYRAKFSAITEVDLKKAMQNLISPNRNEALSVDARQELDLRIGCAFTRFQTKFFHGKYGNLDSSLISFGPCQTPTLGFCVDRHDKIQHFKPEPYWVYKFKWRSTLTLDWERVRVFDREVGQTFLTIVKKQSDAVVTDVQQKEKTKARPQALNTVEMLRTASSGLGMGPQQTMQIAERLYTQGYISYPRTETTQYSTNFDFRAALQELKHSSWAEEVKQLLSTGYQHPKSGHDAGDHPPITPLKGASEAELGSHDAWRLYQFVTQHFLASIMPDCKYLQTVVTFDVSGETFSCTGKTLLDAGFTAVMTWQAIGADEKMPHFTIGQKCAVHDAKMVERKTSPPDHLTESELISLMEKHGIGTDASIPVHINNICERNYVTILTGRKLQPTTLGIILVHGYQKIDADLVKPTIRAALEAQLNLISQGRARFESVLSHAVEIFQRKFKYYVENIGGMDELFEASFSPLAESGKPLTKCGKCYRYMKYIELRPSRLHCANCNDTYSLPMDGTIRLYKEQKCPLDEFELVLCSVGTKGKNFVLCPYCYNNPPFGDMKKGSGCNLCTHPTCPHSFSQTGVAGCMECNDGILALDPASAPKWKFVCNKCNSTVLCFDGAQKVAVDDDECEQCQSSLVHVQYAQGKSPLVDGLAEYTGCMFCDDMLLQHVKMKTNEAINKQTMAARRGGFRRRGRGGRGRGGRGGRGGGRGGRGGGRGSRH